MKLTGRRRVLRAILQFLPKSVRFAYLRRAIRISDEAPPPSLEFKIAETAEELEAAYQILHDTYVDSGYQKPDPSGMRIVKYFALPTTTTLIAKWDGRVIGTMSIIRKGPFGLPIESIFDISSVEAGGRTVAEVSSLAIASQFRHKRGALFLPLCKFFYMYIKRYMHLDRVVIAVNPAWSDFYEGFLDFSLLEKRVVGNYDFANGAPAVGLWSDVTTWEERFVKLYSKRKPAQNFFSYFVERDLACLKFPERNYQKAMDPVMTPEMLDYFFRRKSSVFHELSQADVLALYSCYPQKAYSMVLPKLSEVNFRKSARYSVSASGDAGAGKKIRVLDVSEVGVRVQGPLPSRTQFEFKVQVAPEREATLRGIIHWIDEATNSYGVELLKVDEVWSEYLEYLRSDFEPLKAEDLLVLAATKEKKIS